MQYLLTQEEYDALKNSQPSRDAVEKEVRSRLLEAAPKFVRQIDLAMRHMAPMSHVHDACRALIASAFPPA